MRHCFWAIIVVVIAFCSCANNGVEIGVPLPLWEEGELDIHFINTGRGECTYQIFPDGTTFLVDASGSLMKKGRLNPVDAKPTPDISAGKVIVDYINHFTSTVSEGHINYFLLTHRHGDHLGTVNADELPMYEDGSFLLSSLPEIGVNLILDRIMDRDPDFTYPTSASQDSDLIYNYRAFLEWTKVVNGTEIKKWNVGSCTQVTPLNNPSCGVSIRNYSGNGRFWTGYEEDSYSEMPTKEEFEMGVEGAVPNENAFSCSYILKYGDFDFFLGGDLQREKTDRYPYMDVEAPVGKVAHKVEVMKANHHGCGNAQSPCLLSVLCPDVWLVGVWVDNQMVSEAVDRVLEANPNCEIFCTNMPDRIVSNLGEERLKSVVSQYGHIVVRVAKGGESYMIYTLEDSDEEYRVKSIHGPYQCM